MRGLLDVNVLIALLDAGHVDHQRATAWLSRHVQYGWASCPLTQNGCIRIMAQPAYPRAVTAAEVAERLALATAEPTHEFWPADISLLDPQTVRYDQVLGHRQITDIYLLALALTRGGRFVTLDRGVQTNLVPGASDRHLVIIP